MLNQSVARMPAFTLEGQIERISGKNEQKWARLIRFQKCLQFAHACVQTFFQDALLSFLFVHLFGCEQLLLGNFERLAFAFDGAMKA